MINFLRKNFSVILLFITVFLFFWKFFLKRLIPFPGDMLVGAYYPWLDYKWSGFTTSVPIKNPLITDVFSQFYLWKETIANSIRFFQIPLWNIFSYSGYPLLANFHSGVFNPFNLLMVFLPRDIGWSLIVISQFIFSSLTMFLFLKKNYKNSFSCLIGAIVYSFSGFMITWSQFVTAGFACVWLPLIFLNIKSFFDTKKIKYLLFLSLLYFLLMTSGHFQSLIYGCIFSGLYFLYKLFSSPKLKLKNTFWFSFSVILGILFMSIQLFPTLELGKYSIRFNENYISEYNYGLLSFDRIITFFAPDYFGNPATFNFWGSFNYHETVIYFGIIAIFALIFSIFQFQKLKEEKFFLITAVISLLLAFNTPLGKLIYTLKVPGISTSAAGRIIFISIFCFAILVANFIQNISIHNFKNSFRYYWGYFLFLFIILIFTIYSIKLNQYYPLLLQNYNVGFRNLFFPIVISTIMFFILAFIKRKSLKLILIFILVIFDLFRFGWKYTPFVNREYLFPKTDVTTFLQNQNGLFRIEKEKGPLFTPNTWSAYSLQSTSGYDPMALQNYNNFFQKKLNNQSSESNSSRYSEIENYSAQNLGEANVKYLLALKYDSVDKISSTGNNLNYKINQKDWKKVSEYGSVVVLENTNFKPRVEIKNDKNDSSININNYSANKIQIQVNTQETGSVLILRDTWYPGWQAFINGREVTIQKYLNVYRQIELPKGNSLVEFVYHPKSFIYGLYVSIASLSIWVITFIKYKNKIIK